MSMEQMRMNGYENNYDYDKMKPLFDSIKAPISMRSIVDEINSDLAFNDHSEISQSVVHDHHQHQQKHSEAPTSSPRQNIHPPVNDNKSKSQQKYRRVPQPPPSTMTNKKFFGGLLDVHPQPPLQRSGSLRLPKGKYYTHPMSSTFGFTPQHVNSSSQHQQPTFGLHDSITTNMVGIPSMADSTAGIMVAAQAMTATSRTPANLFRAYSTSHIMQCNQVGQFFTIPPQSQPQVFILTPVIGATFNANV
ncbi:unnamed protein product [Didymodactylos carnosus]|uniref:Uncharacterized protein n=1 Tax=Didymodactylos carnosus TaxID=1234261 RepID=A0A814UTE3_9BILA|nr:unnamed protein product [Didymodactylos carnosus]CAF1551617.1 unnamed protein product [Didymodactylos carnosus]CAF3942822.1 unnamed protein product [Didymodactylos carnosus]CAF4341958.1 unnamed protein product [Didymodactylos carnosus]